VAALRLASLAILLAATPAPAQEMTLPPVPAEDVATLADMFPDGLPSLLTPETLTRSYRLPPNIAAGHPDSATVQYSEGPVKFAVGSKVTPNKPATTSVVPQIPDPKIVGGAAGGTGEVKGEVRLTEGQWELYGTQKFGVVQADGASPAAQDSTTFGSLYHLPGATGGKIGASLELAPTDERKTRIEYRQQFGPAEGFVAAEQTFVPEGSTAKTPPPSVRGGVSRKF
jgi:hypothetical protein